MLVMRAACILGIADRSVAANLLDAWFDLGERLVWRLLSGHITNALNGDNLRRLSGMR